MAIVTAGDMIASGCRRMLMSDKDTNIFAGPNEVSEDK